MKIDVTSCKRTIVPEADGSNYFCIEDDNILITTPSENRGENLEIRSWKEFACRIASKGMKGQITLRTVAEQMTKANRCRNTSVGGCAEKVVEYLAESMGMTVDDYLAEFPVLDD